MLEATARVYGIDMAEFAGQQPIGRLLDPDEVAAAIAWLAGPDSSGMTGTVMSVDGGLSV
jgi:NAD(P)-dependent dehydrogenase (short-subunit alcohol dehydrogenase family)